MTRQRQQHQSAYLPGNNRSRLSRAAPTLLLAATLCGPSTGLAEEIAEELAEQLQQATELLDACRSAEARSILEALLLELPGHAEATFQLGMSYLAENDHDPALEHLARAAELDPRRSHYALSLGEAHGRKARAAGLFAQISLARSAREGFEAAVDIDPDNLAARRNLVEFYVRAPGLMGGGKDEAEAQVAAIAERDEALGHEARGLLYRYQKRDDEAIAEYRRAIELAPQIELPRFQLGLFLLDRRRADEAAEVLAEMAKSFPGNKLALYELGEAAAESGTHLEEAVDALQRYLEQPLCHEDPTRVEALSQLGRVFEHLGQTKQAIAALQEAVELAPDFKPARKALKRLTNDNG